MFNYEASAELFPARHGKRSGGAMQYRRFDRAADAIRYAIETLSPAMLGGAFLEVNERRFSGAQIRDLYESPDYPLERAVVANPES